MKLTRKRTPRSTNQRAARLGTRLTGVALLLVGTVALIGHPASAATQNAVATITDPANAQPLTSGGSATVFTVSLPTGAACSGDTANQGYHVYSYLLPQGTSVAGVTFVNQPSAGYGLYDNAGDYYGTANTAINTGGVIGIPTNFVWAPLVTDQIVTGGLAGLLGNGTAATWEAGLACANTSGVVTDWWNTDVTFTASSSDAAGFTWTATAGGTAGGGATTTTTIHVTSTTRPKTTTTKPGTRTTTTAAPTTTTTTASDATTTTVFSVGSTIPSSGDSGDPGSSGFVDSSGFGTGSGSLPRTGSPIHRDVGLGLFAIGAGMILLGIDMRWKARGALAA